MKLILAVFFTLVASAFTQGPTVTDVFLTQQADLALTHEFFEMAIFLNRGQVSSYLYRINREIIESHINTYAFIKTRGLEAEAELDAIEVTENNEECLNNIKNRWSLQVAR